MAEKLSTMERIANALAMLGQATHAIQNTSIAVTHVANHHEVLAQGAHRLADVAEKAATHLGGAVEVAARMAGAAERFVVVVEREAPRFVDAVVKLADRDGLVRAPE